MDFVQAIMTRDKGVLNEVTKKYSLAETYKKEGVYDNVLMNIGRLENPKETDPMKVRTAGANALYQMFNTELMNSRANMMNAITNKRRQDL
ncbi:unnamed protein product, partial [marine sediment metagenome]